MHLRETLCPSSSVISLVCMSSCDTAHVRYVAATVKGRSSGAIVWFSPAVNLIISSHLGSSSLSHCSETEAAVRPASGPLTRASPSISQNYSAVWFHQMQQRHGWVPSALGGRYVRGLAGCRGTTVGDCPETAVSPCFIMSSSLPLNPLAQSLRAAGSPKLSEQHGSSWGNLTLPEIPPVVLSPRRNGALMKCLEADVPDRASGHPRQGGHLFVECLLINSWRNQAPNQNSLRGCAEFRTPLRIRALRWCYQCCIWLSSDKCSVRIETNNICLNMNIVVVSMAEQATLVLASSAGEI